MILSKNGYPIEVGDMVWFPTLGDIEYGEIIEINESKIIVDSEYCQASIHIDDNIAGVVKIP